MSRNKPLAVAGTIAASLPSLTLRPRALDHLVKCFREGRISAEDFLKLKHWVESDPEVPNGKWYKHFKSGILAGHGEIASTFLAPGMAVEGEEVE